MALTYEMHYKNEFIEITDLVERWNISIKEVVALLNNGELILFCLGKYSDWNIKKSDELIKFDKDGFALERHVFYNNDPALKKPFRCDSENILRYVRESDTGLCGYTEGLIPINKNAQQSMFNAHGDCMVYGCFLTAIEKLEEKNPEYIGKSTTCDTYNQQMTMQEYSQKLAEKDALIGGLQQKLAEKDAVIANLQQKLIELDVINNAVKEYTLINTVITLKAKGKTDKEIALFLFNKGKGTNKSQTCALLYKGESTILNSKTVANYWPVLMNE